MAKKGLYPPSVKGRKIDSSNLPMHPDYPYVISERKKQIDALKAQGKTYREIEKIAGVSTVTIAMSSGKNWHMYALWNELQGFLLKAGIGRAEFKKVYKTMSDRKFKIVKKYDENLKNYVHGAVIKCSTEGCANSAMFVRSGGGVIHPVHAAIWFRNKGWIVGANERSDKCPDCNARINSGNPSKPKEEVKMIAEEVKAVAIPKADQKTMGRQDKQIIFAKLMEAYPNVDKGYVAGWSDQKVADDLGVPVEWVASVREADFGPEFDTVLLDKKYKELEDMGRAVLDAKKLVDEAMRDRDRATKLVETRIDEFEEKLRVFSTAWRLVKDRKI